MQVSEGMSKLVLTVGPSHSLREMAVAMTERKVGSAVVHRSRGAGPTASSPSATCCCRSARGEDPDSELVADHLTAKLVYATPEWSLEQAAVAMVRGGFRHLVVIDGGEIAGVLSVRDIVRCWTDDAASRELPPQPTVASPRGSAARARRAQWSCSSGSSSMSRRVSRDPPDRRPEEQQQAHDDHRPRERDPDDGDRQTGRVEDRDDARLGHVDVLARRRGLVFADVGHQAV